MSQGLKEQEQSPTDLLVLEDNRPLTSQIMQISFEFGKAMAAMDPAQSWAVSHSTPGPPARCITSE
jgi:hypothetical protein